MPKITIPPILQPHFAKWRKAMHALLDQPFEPLQDQAALLESEKKHLSPFTAELGKLHREKDIPAYSKNAAFILDYIAFYSVDLIVNMMGEYEYSFFGIGSAVVSIPLHCRTYINPAAYYLDAETCVPYITSEKIYQKMLWLEWILTKMTDYINHNPKFPYAAAKVLNFFINKRLPPTTNRLNAYAKEHQLKRLSIDELEKALDAAHPEAKPNEEKIQNKANDKLIVAPNIAPLQNAEPLLVDPIPEKIDLLAEGEEEKFNAPNADHDLSITGLLDESAMDNLSFSQRSSSLFRPMQESQLLQKEKDSLIQQLTAYSEYLFTHFVQKKKEYDRVLIGSLVQYPASTRYFAAFNLLQSLQNNTPPNLSPNHIAALQAGTLRKIISQFEHKLFLPVAITDIKDKVRSKEKLIEDLQTYIANRLAEKLASDSKYYYFWSPLFGESADVKTSAAIKLLQLMKGKLQDESNKPISFEKNERQALGSRRLGAIVAKYEKYVVLPQEFHDATARFKM